jgi:ATP-dependent Clp protease ATP-binding subunit ClpA
MNRYDDRARLVFHHAREEGARLGQYDIGPEHLLLGLLPAGGLGGQALAQLSLDQVALRQALVALTGNQAQGPGPTAFPTILPYTHELMEQAAQQADTLGSEVIGSEHILLGLLAQTSATGPTLAQHMLLQLGVDLALLQEYLAKNAAIASQASKTSHIKATASSNDQGNDQGDSQTKANIAIHSAIQMIIGEDVSRLRDPIMEIFALAQAEAATAAAGVVNSVHLLAGLMQHDSAAAGILAAQ